MKREDTLKQLILELLGVDIMVANRNRELVDARKIYSTILHSQGQGVTTIAKTIDKNHATIIHYIKDSEILLLMDKTFKDNYDMICNAYDRKMQGGEIPLMTRLQLENEVERLREENFNIKLKYLTHLNKQNETNF